MISNEVSFRVYERPNTFSPTGTEWAFYCRSGDHEEWVITSWAYRPNDEEVQQAKDVAFRAFEMHHRHMRIPPFNLSEV
jgi:hypothetical protein